jgi:hypothetical protein
MCSSGHSDCRVPVEHADEVANRVLGWAGSCSLGASLESQAGYGGWARRQTT